MMSRDARGFFTFFSLCALLATAFSGFVWCINVVDTIALRALVCFFYSLSWLLLFTMLVGEGNPIAGYKRMTGYDV